MPGRNPSQRAEQRRLREQMRGLGMSRAEIAADMARRYKLRSRAAWRAAWGWTLEEAAERYNTLRARDSTEPVTALTGSRLSEWENWPFSTRKPPVTGLCLLAEIYQCGVLDLIDFHDREKLAPAELLTLDRAGAVPPPRDEDHDPRKQAQAPGVPPDPGGALDPDDTTAPHGPARSGAGLATMFTSSLTPTLGMPEGLGAGQWVDGLPAASVIPAVSALTEVLLGYIRADRLIGSVALAGAIGSHAPMIGKVCEAAKGTDRIAALTFACRFLEFCGWAHQDAGDLGCAMRWTDRALDYALELADRRVVAYTLMRKAAIATEAGLPAHGLGLAGAALSDVSALTPRLRAVILRQRAFAHAMLGEPGAAARDAETAITEAIAGLSQGEEDRAPYCSPMYAAMEAGAVQVLLGNPAAALPALEQSRLEWSDPAQARDLALCLSRLATAYAAAGEREQALAAAADAIATAREVSSRRVTGQLVRLRRILSEWGSDPATAEILRKLGAAAGPGVAAV